MFKKYIYIICTCVLCMCVQTKIVFADTYIQGQLITSSTVWKAKQGPYIIQGSVLVASSTLRIEAGAVVVFKGGSLMTRGGSISVEGVADKSVRVRVSESGPVMFSGDHGSITMHHVNVDNMYNRKLIDAWNRSRVSLTHIEHNGEGADNTLISVFDNSVSTIDSLRVIGWRYKVLEVFTRSHIDLTNSYFSEGDKALVIFDESTGTIAHNRFAQYAKAIHVNNAEVEIRKNDFEYNAIAIHKDTAEDMLIRMHAEDNWWGGTTGVVVLDELDEFEPVHTNVVVGNILVSPWSSAPNTVKSDMLCCSSVLFLPGLMGSRLYEKGSLFENQLWEPNRNGDVKKLFMDESGESLHTAIYTRDIMRTTNLLGGSTSLEVSPYKAFSSYLDKLVKEKTITEWKEAPYDWRFAPDSIIQDGTRIGNGKSVNVQYMADNVIELAHRSKTKKVTIITHSNGGLVAKMLMLELQSRGKDRLVDRIIYIGMPEYGTPQAITSLLFGHEQSIAGGLVLKASIAKELGKNMPTAYTLLPSDLFFGDSTTRTFTIRAGDSSVKNTNELHTVLFSYPHVNKDLLKKASQIHQKLSSWSPRSELQIFQIVGTGLLTVSGVQKLDSKKFVPIYSQTGDGVVQDMFDVHTKRFQRTGHVIAIDLSKEISPEGLSEYKHLNLTNTPTVLSWIDSLLRNTSSVPAGIDADELNTVHADGDAYQVLEISKPEELVDDMQLEYKKPKDVFVDTYTPMQNSSFDKTGVTSALARYELFADNVFHVSRSETGTSTLHIQSTRSEPVNISISKHVPTSGGAIIQQVVYPSIPVFSAIDVSINTSNISNGPSLLVQSAGGLHSEVVEPLQTITVDSEGKQTVHNNTATTTKESLDIRIQKTIDKIASSTVSSFLKARYIRRLEVFRKNKQPVYFQALYDRLRRALASVDRYKNNPVLRARYSKNRSDYILLLYAVHPLID